MSIDFTSLGVKMKSVIKMLGVPVKVTRLGASVLADYAVFVHSTSGEDSSSALSKIAIVNIKKTYAYVGGSFSKLPEPGDKVVGTKREYIVTDVEIYQPGAVMVGFKLELE